MNTTLEYRIKHVHRLEAGTHCVLLTHSEQSRKALVKIDDRGRIEALMQPQSEDMYTAWRGIEGDDTSAMVSSVIVWGCRDKALMSQFDADPVATIPLLVKAQ